MTNPQIPTNRQIKKLLKQIVFGKNVYCPRCHSYRIVSRQERYYCRSCRRRFSLTSHTFLKESKVPLQTMWLVIWCFVHQVPVKQTEGLTHLSQKAVRHWFELLRRQLRQLDTRLKGIIQVDEVYIGGFRGKAIIVGKEIKTKEVRFYLCEFHEVYATDFYAFFETYITPESVIHTDSHPLYPKVCRHFNCTHRRDLHAKFEFHLTSEIEGYFGNLRTFIRRMYHHVTTQNLPEYLIEFQYRFSRKHYFTSVDQFLLNTLKLVPTG